MNVEKERALIQRTVPLPQLIAMVSCPGICGYIKDGQYLEAAKVIFKANIPFNQAFFFISNSPETIIEYLSLLIESKVEKVNSLIEQASKIDENDEEEELSLELIKRNEEARLKNLNEQREQTKIIQVIANLYVQIIVPKLLSYYDDKNFIEKYKKFRTKFITFIKNYKEYLVENNVASIVKECCILELLKEVYFQFEDWANYLNLIFEPGEVNISEMTPEKWGELYNYLSTLSIHDQGRIFKAFDFKFQKHLLENWESLGMKNKIKNISPLIPWFIDMVFLDLQDKDRDVSKLLMPIFLWMLQMKNGGFEGENLSIFFIYLVRSGEFSKLDVLFKHRKFRTCNPFFMLFWISGKVRAENLSKLEAEQIEDELKFIKKEKEGQFNITEKLLNVPHDLRKSRPERAETRPEIKKKLLPSRSSQVAEGITSGLKRMGSAFQIKRRNTEAVIVERESDGEEIPIPIYLDGREKEQNEAEKPAELPELPEDEAQGEGEEEEVPDLGDFADGFLPQATGTGVPVMGAVHNEEGEAPAGGEGEPSVPAEGIAPAGEGESCQEAPTPAGGEDGAPTPTGGEDGTPTPAGGEDGAPTPAGGEDGAPTPTGGEGEVPVPAEGAAHTGEDKSQYDGDGEGAEHPSPIEGNSEAAAPQNEEVTSKKEELKETGENDSPEPEGRSLQEEVTGATEGEHIETEDTQNEEQISDEKELKIEGNKEPMPEGSAPEGAQEEGSEKEPLRSEDGEREKPEPIDASNIENNEDLNSEEKQREEVPVEENETETPQSPRPEEVSKEPETPEATEEPKPSEATPEETPEATEEPKPSEATPEETPEATEEPKPSENAKDGLSGKEMEERPRLLVQEAEPERDDIVESGHQEEIVFPDDTDATTPTPTSSPAGPILEDESHPTVDVSGDESSESPIASGLPDDESKEAPPSDSPKHISIDPKYLTKSHVPLRPEDRHAPEGLPPPPAEKPEPPTKKPKMPPPEAPPAEKPKPSKEKKRLGFKAGFSFGKKKKNKDKEVAPKDPAALETTPLIIPQKPEEQSVTESYTDESISISASKSVFTATNFIGKRLRRSRHAQREIDREQGKEIMSSKERHKLREKERKEKKNQESRFEHVAQTIDSAVQICAHIDTLHALSVRYSIDSCIQRSDLNGLVTTLTDTLAKTKNDDEDYRNCWLMAVAAVYELYINTVRFEVCFTARPIVKKLIEEVVKQKMFESHKDITKEWWQSAVKDLFDKQPNAKVYDSLIKIREDVLKNIVRMIIRISPSDSDNEEFVKNYQEQIQNFATGSDQGCKYLKNLDKEEILKLISLVVNGIVKGENTRACWRAAVTVAHGVMRSPKKYAHLQNLSNDAITVLTKLLLDFGTRDANMKFVGMGFREYTEQLDKAFAAFLKLPNEIIQLMRMFYIRIGDQYRMVTPDWQWRRTIKDTIHEVKRSHGSMPKAQREAEIKRMKLMLEFDDFTTQQIRRIFDNGIDIKEQFKLDVINIIDERHKTVAELQSNAIKVLAEQFIENSVKHSKDTWCKAVYSLYKIEEHNRKLEVLSNFDESSLRMFAQSYERTLDNFSDKRNKKILQGKNPYSMAVCECFGKRAKWLTETCKEVKEVNGRETTVDVETPNTSWKHMLALALSPKLLQLDDLLPLVPSSMDINILHTAILDSITHFQEMSRGSDVRVQGFIERAVEQREAINVKRPMMKEVDSVEQCWFCKQSIYNDRFVIFPCNHAVHIKCFLSNMDLYFDAPEQLDLISLQASAARGRGLDEDHERIERSDNITPREELEKKLCSSCPVCGELSVEVLDKDFFYEDSEEASLWALT